MWQVSSHSVPPRVLARYSLPNFSYNWIRVAGGFSGADVWRGEDESGVPRLALKCWPASISSGRLEFIHDWIGLAAHLPIVPRLLRSIDGSMTVEEDGRLWDLTDWKPGRPLENAAVREAELACEAVANLHASWSRLATRATCPGIIRRCDVLRYWRAEPRLVVDEPDQEGRELLLQAQNCAARLAPTVLRELDPWKSAPMWIQPCIRDLRREHLLFDAGRVSGVIDYGAMDFDSPAIDLARLLGDLSTGQASLRSAGLKKYRECIPSNELDDELIALLERADVVCSLIGWLERFSSGQVRGFSAEINRRLAYLIFRAAS